MKKRNSDVSLPPMVDRELLERMSLHVPDKRSGTKRLTNDEIERALVSGEHQQTLETYFGPEEYSDLVRLARDAQRKRTTRGAPRVLILPGICGSTLARSSGTKLDTIWIDFLDIVRGKMRDLKMPDEGKTFRAIDAYPGTYLKLKLFLQAQGFNAESHPFDWRRSIPDLGRELAERIAADPANEIFLVAHSMGGLVARAALHADGGELPKLKRLVMLGTPNFGSFAPVLVYRGLYPFLKKLALLDLVHSAEELGAKILNTFPGLMEMMPQRSKFSGLDLYDLSQWPLAGGRPHPDVLPLVSSAQQKLGVDAKRFVMIAGVNKETTTGVSRVGGEFVFERSNAGDGTVPLDFAVLPDVSTYFYEEEHGAMPKNPTLHRAVADILNDGSSSDLPTEWQRTRSEWKRRVAESDLRQELDAAAQRTRGNITAAELRSIVEEFAAPESADVTAEVAAAAAGPRVAAPGGHIRNAIVIGRRTQRRVEVRLARGSLTQVRSRAYVLGAFQGVDPSGAALAVDQLMDGAITEFRQRRMFSHSVGELIILPASWHDVRADHVVFAGLGPIDRFGAQVLQTAAENVARSMVHANIEEFATVLIGAGTGIDIPTALGALLCGFFAGLNDADEHQSFRAITFCEMDAARYTLLRSSLLQLSTTEICDATEFTFIDLPPPPPEPVSASRARIVSALPPSIYLHVRSDRNGSGPITFETSLLTSGPKATVLPGKIVVLEPQLRAQLDLIETARFRHSFLPQFGQDLAALVLPEPIASALKRHLDHHLVIVHDAEASRIPWEVLCLEGEFPALKGGISRRYVANQLAVAKWLEARREDEVLDVLLVVNPTEDLPGAEAEGNRVLDLFNRTPRGRVVTLRGAEATKARLRSEFSSGNYDLLHYAGHAFFDAARPARSGILCSGGEVLSGAELAELGHLPSLVFFNACEAGRIRKPGMDKNRHATKNIRQRIERNVSLAEAFLRGGVANYVGTYWPVNDSAAETFADTFYRALLQEKTIGEALAVGRSALDAAKNQDWADYIFYGSVDFSVKKTRV